MSLLDKLHNDMFGTERTQAISQSNTTVKLSDDDRQLIVSDVIKGLRTRSEPDTDTDTDTESDTEPDAE